MIPTDKQRHEEEEPKVFFGSRDGEAVSVPIKKYDFPCLEEEKPFDPPFNFAEELVMIGKAVAAAKKAFEDHISKEGFDPSYWRLQVEVEFLGSNLEDVLRRLKLEEVA